MCVCVGGGGGLGGGGGGGRWGNNAMQNSGNDERVLRKGPVYIGNVLSLSILLF